jgi:hypothetical protein
MSEEDTELNQKSIIELQNEINNFKKKERSYLVELQIKDEIIEKLTSFKNGLINQINESLINNSKSKNTDYLDQRMLNEFKNLKNILKEKETMLLSREEELNSLQTNQPNFTKFIIKSKNLQNENYEFVNYIQGNFLENLRSENTNEQSQINQLMIKLKESDENINDYENQIDEANETISFLKRKIKMNEEIKPPKKVKNK